MPVNISAPLTVQTRVIPVQPEDMADRPPTLRFVIAFFTGYKEKIFLVGVVAILAGMGLVVVDLLTAGVVAPFTAQLTVGLFSFGASAIGASVTAKFMSGEQIGEAKDKEGSGDQKKLVRPRGKRCSRAFQKHPPHAGKVTLIDTEKEARRSAT